MSKAKSQFVVPEGFAAIRASMLMPERTLGVEISVLINGRAVRWALEGDVLDRARLDKILGHKIKKVLIRVEDEKAFRSYIERAFEDTLASKSSTAEQKVNVTASASDMAAQDVLANPDDKDAYTRSQVYFERLGSLVASMPGGLREILARPYSAETHDHMSHSLRVAAISVALAEKLALVANEKDRTALVTACYLHDAALESAGILRSHVHAAGTVRQDIEGWKKHPMDGADLFQGKDFVNSRVLRIIAQHEETPTGDGFPQGLTKTKMDPLAIVVSLVNRFEDCFERHGGNAEVAMADCFKTELGRFELEHLTHLKSIILQAPGSRA
ncbi:MAG: HD domain-containing protein [Bdellovibrionota bacterium]